MRGWVARRDWPKTLPRNLFPTSRRNQNPTKNLSQIEIEHIQNRERFLHASYDRIDNRIAVWRELVKWKG